SVPKTLSARRQAGWELDQPSAPAPPAASLPPLCSARCLTILAEAPKDVVVAGGGVVGEDGRQQVGERDSGRRELEPAALALAGRPAVGRVGGDEIGGGGEAGGAEWVGSAVEDAAPWAVAAVSAQAAGAPNGQVADQRPLGNGEDPAVLVRDAATLAGPA